MKMYCECPAGPEKFGGKPRRARKNWGKAPQGQNYRGFHRNHMGTYGNDIYVCVFAMFSCGYNMFSYVSRIFSIFFSGVGGIVKNGPGANVRGGVPPPPGTSVDTGFDFAIHLS